MVDMTSNILKRETAGSRHRSTDAHRRQATFVGVADATRLAAYRAFCADKVTGPAQHPIWVEAWAEHVNPDILFLTINRDDQPFCMLPIEIIAKGKFRIARYPGGNHANGNLPPVRSGEASVNKVEFNAMLAALKQARPDIDLLTLERNNPQSGNIDHPFRDLASWTSPNVSLAADLRDGMDALLNRMNGKRKRKRYKTHRRKFEELGGFQINEARTASEVELVLKRFFALKARRFAKAGIPDVFAEPSIQHFFRALFVNALESEKHPFVIDALEVGGQIKAVNAVSVTKHSAVCEFGAICDDNNRISPGFFLDYHHIAKYAEAGKDFYDFSVGDEEYKRSWCEVETLQFDCVAALNLKGRLLRSYIAVRTHTISWVKSNERLLTMVKRIRKLLVRTGK